MRFNAGKLSENMRQFEIELLTHLFYQEGLAYHKGLRSTVITVFTESLVHFHITSRYIDSFDVQHYKMDRIPLQCSKHNFGLPPS